MPKHHIPNLLTLLRILLVPALIAVYLTAQHTYLPFVLFTLIAMTDYLDGYLARRWSVQSALGAFLDPAADKILVCSLLVLLVAEHSTWLFTLPAIVIIFRELVMSMLREYLAKIAKSEIIAVDVYGKYKTAAQMLSLGFFLMPHLTMLYPAYAFLYISTALTVLSLTRYIIKIQKTGLIPAFER
ncbi:MAG: CDP-diacylglycerol--glycerol-3-phosphate 3-phosphatidyltransferase [Rheinheimera sp.]|nr:CDP-diacylglycerol--glycerol-3-phosphate 3-phosphatidyltransferase [Rheinheimera sp.]MBM34126.1 CDP-diacylglycerol--glycerol-3-phosphate 3-phosphatidyltransferase [Rheinheimera sp.]